MLPFVGVSNQEVLVHQTRASCALVEQYAITMDFVQMAAFAKEADPPQFVIKYPDKHKRRSEMFASLLLCRLVDLFDTYLVQVIAEVVSLRPELLKTSQEVKLDYVLGFDSMEELRRDLIEQTIVRLGSQGLDEIEKWFEKRIGINDIHSGANRDDIIEALVTRNVLTHNHGHVDRRYLQRVKGHEIQAWRFGGTRCVRP